jgi:hypothetical protein
MNISLPIWIAAAQWVLLFGLGALVIAMYRQLGYYLQIQRTGAENLGLGIGEIAPAFDFTSPDGTVGTRGRFNPAGQWSLLLFADPRCASCERAVYALEALHRRGDDSRLRTLVVTRASPAQVAAAEAFHATTAEIALVDDDRALDLYRVRQVPFAHVVDPQGIVRAKGVAEDQAALRELLRPVRRPSIPLIPIVSSPPTQSSVVS